MTQSYFKNIKAVLSQELNTAKSNIYVAVAWFTDAEILAILTAKRKAGLKVIIVISNDFKNFKESYSLDFEPFKAAGGKLLVMDKAFMHHKFSIVDDTTLITGTANYTYSGFHKNAENIMVVNEATLVGEFLEQFNSLADYFKFEESLILSPQKTKAEAEIKWSLMHIELLEQELVAAQKVMELYEVQYRLRFGELILQILAIEKQKLEHRANLTAKVEDKLRYENILYTYEQLKNSKTADTQFVTAAADPKQQKTLKELFREGVKLCHPDNAFIAEHLKQRAQEIFIKLKEAYLHNDMEMLNTLLNDLKSGIALGNIDYKNLAFENLQSLLDQLKEKITILSEAINALKVSQKYGLALDTNTLHDFFDKEELLLKEKLRQLVG